MNKKYIYGILMGPVKHIHDGGKKLFEVSRALCYVVQNVIEHKVIL